MIIERIQKQNDVKELSYQECNELSQEIRDFLIDTLSRKGGHLASNLGTVELTIALHRVLDFPKDKLIFDVGHQSYTHKILTGRKDEFETLREYDGLSGFPKRSESECDAFGTGHASTSLSAGLGMVRARDILGEDYKVVSVIGDGSLTGGMAYEAINNAGELRTNFTIVLNDNNMSISENVGGMSKQLSKLRTSQKYTDLKENVQTSLERIPIYGDKLVAQIRRTKNGIKQLVIPGMSFEEMGIMYLGPVNGHNIKEVEEVLKDAFQFKGAVLVHVITEKGKGFEPAEKHPARFHGAEPFDKETGLPANSAIVTYSDVFSTVMRKLGDRDEKLCAVTAAMMDGTGLRRFHNMFPDRFFDVGIAEEHAVTFAAGLASCGLHPVVAIYSSFLQRAYDQILHDVCIQDLPVTFAIDRAGIVGHDGPTHNGVFDISYLSEIPNMTLCAPKNKWELSDMMKFALSYGHPIAIRYPKGEAYDGLKEHRAKIILGKCEPLKSEQYSASDEDSQILLFALGSMVKTAISVRNRLFAAGIPVSITNARFVKPLDTEYLLKAIKKYSIIITMEENVHTGGFGEQVEDFLFENGYTGRIINISLPDEFIPQGDVAFLKKKFGLDSESIYNKVVSALDE